MDKKELLEQLEQLKADLEKTVGEKAKKEIEAQIKALEAKIPDTKSIETSVQEVKSSVDEVKDAVVKLDETAKANQQVIDDAASFMKSESKSKKGKLLTFDEAMGIKLAEEGVAEQLKEVRKGKSFVLDFKGMGPIQMTTKLVGAMTNSASLTGDSVASYSGRQGILPAQKINFRDIMPTVNSDTGLYVHYRESGGEGSVSTQTEGSGKEQLDFDFTEVKTVNKYVAGFSRFSKQLMKSLPWLQTTLPRLLLRKFYNAENAYFYGAVSGAATGSGSTTESDAVKALIDLIADQRTANFNASYALVDHLTMAKFQKRTYTTGNYAGSGGVVSMPDGSIRIADCPIIPASWVDADEVLIIDNDYLERVEVEGLRVEFFEQDSDNVQKNLITARVECYEEVNLMLPTSAILFNIADAS